jgi:hypothetical protein
VDVKRTAKYRSMLGSALYVEQWTRPDVSHSVSLLARHASNPGPKHYTALKRVLQYLHATSAAGLRWSRDPTLIKHGRYGMKLNKLYAYADADYAADRDKRKSRSGFVIYLNGAPVSWRSKLQSVVALSTAESEYIAASQASQEIIYLRNLLSRLGFSQDEATPLHEDNEACVQLAKNPVYRERSKHIEVRYHYIRDQVEHDRVVMVPIKTDINIADVFTKALGKVKFTLFRDEMMVWIHVLPTKV